MADFTWVDYLVFGIFFLSFIMGVSRGLVKEIITVLTLIVAFIFTIRWSAQLANYLYSMQGALDVISSISTYTGLNAAGPLSTIVLIISILLIFVGVYSIGEAVNYFTPVDFIVIPGITGLLYRILGGALGLAVGYGLNLMFLLILGMTPVAGNSAYTNSYYVARMQPNVTKLANLIAPQGMSLSGVQ